MAETDKTALRARKKAEKARRKEEKYYLASQWQLMARKLGKHQLARISLVILGFLYFAALFGNFLAPYSLTEYDANSKDLPPTPVHFSHDGKFIGPFVYHAERQTVKMSVAEKSAAQKAAKERGEKYTPPTLIATDDTEPITSPSTKLISVPAKGMVSDTWLPKMMRLNRSRPMLSAPKRNTLPFSTPNRCRSLSIRPRNL